MSPDGVRTAPWSRSGPSSGTGREQDPPSQPATPDEIVRAGDLVEPQDLSDLHGQPPLSGHLGQVVSGRLLGPGREVVTVQAGAGWCG